MSKIYSLSELKSILNPVFSEHGVRKAVLFGSYAKGTATEHSDVDLLVDSGLRGLKFFGLLESVICSLVSSLRDVFANSPICMRLKTVASTRMESASKSASCLQF